MPKLDTIYPIWAMGTKKLEMLNFLEDLQERSVQLHVGL